MWRIIISPKANKKLKNIKQLFRQDIADAINEIKEDPLIGKPLRRELAGRFTYKVRVYRIVYAINLQNKTIIILNADHRAVVYN